MAFLARYAAGGERDQQADEVLAALSDVERRVLELLLRDPDCGARLRRLSALTRETWTLARFDRTAFLACERLRQRLAKRGLLQP
jgi:hypothetical protein